MGSGISSETVASLAMKEATEIMAVAESKEDALRIITLIIAFIAQWQPNQELKYTVFDPSHISNLN